MKLNFFHKLKFLPAILVVGTMFVGMSVSESRADEPLPIFDPAEYEVKVIIVGKEASFGSDVSVMSERITLYLSEGLSDRGITTPVKVGDIPDYCSVMKHVAVDQESDAKIGKEFYIRIEPTLSRGLGLSFQPCLDGVGPVRFSFPEDWSRINPEAPLRYGDCEPFRSNYIDLKLCWVTPELDFLIYSLAQERGEEK